MSKNTKRIADYVRTAKSKVQNIFEIIRENAREIIQNAEEWFNSHAKELKSVGIKSASTLLTLATLLTASMGLTSCGPTNPNNPESSYSTVDIPAEISTRSPEEIAETGVKAEDVLAQLDLLCQEITRKKYFNDFKNGAFSESDYNTLIGNARFQSITPPHKTVNKEDMEHPYYIHESMFELSSKWLPNRGAWVTAEGIRISLNISQRLGKEQGTDHISSIYLPYDAFRTILLNNGCEEIILNKKDLWDEFPNELLLDMPNNEPSYKGITIDRSFIENASPETLKQIYDTIKMATPLVLNGDSSLYPANNLEEEYTQNE